MNRTKTHLLQPGIVGSSVGYHIPDQKPAKRTTEQPCSQYFLPMWLYYRRRSSTIPVPVTRRRVSVSVPDKGVSITKRRQLLVHHWRWIRQPRSIRCVSCRARSCWVQHHGSRGVRHEGMRIGRGRGDEGEGGDALAGLVGEVEDAVGLAGRHPMDLVADELDGRRATAGTREEIREWDADLADVAVPERALGAEKDVDGVAGEVDVDGDGEADGGVPGWVATTLAVGRGKLPPPAFSGEGDHSVDGHLGDKVYVLKALGRDQGDLQRSARH
ncbi:unnamed protein product, partial [Musa acuminata subsp. malaccensis]